MLDYPKIRNRLASALIDPMPAVELLPFFSVSVDLDATSVAMPRDEDDWMVLATLVAGRGDWLISEDRDLLALAPQYAVITPAAFVARFLR
ncbi:MAG: putative toxin-antitoxin system toxin component, PIN family [Steroidobacteraceae bacterium]